MSETKETSDAVDAPAPTGNERAKEASGLNKVTDFVAERNLDQSRVEAVQRRRIDLCCLRRTLTLVLGCVSWRRPFVPWQTAKKR